MLSEVVQKLRSGINTGDEQVVPSARAADIEQMPLRIKHVFQVGLVADRVDALLKWNDFVVAGHDGDRLELQAFGQVQCSDGDTTIPRFDPVVELASFKTGRRSGTEGAGKLCVRADEQGNFVGGHSLVSTLGEPLRNCRSFLVLGGEDFHRGLWAVEDRDRAAALFGVTIDVGQFGRQESVGLAANLVGSTVSSFRRSAQR